VEGLHELAYPVYQQHYQVVLQEIQARSLSFQRQSQSNNNKKKTKFISKSSIAVVLFTGIKIANKIVMVLCIAYAAVARGTVGL